MSVIEHECPTCDGIGYRFAVNRVTLPDAVPCPLCDGEGKVVPAKQLRGAVARAEAAEAHVEQLLAAENKAWREAETWKDRAVEAEMLIASQRQEIRDMLRRTV